jgi:hypothetical protein
MTQGLRAVIGLAALTLLVGCASTAKVNEYLKVNYVGKNASTFFIANGPRFQSSIDRRHFHL